MGEPVTGSSRVGMRVGLLGWWTATGFLALVAAAGGGGCGSSTAVTGSQAGRARFVRAWGGHGTGPGEFREPVGIAVSRGEVFVSDSGNHRVQVFDREGRFLREFGGNGGGDTPALKESAGNGDEDGGAAAVAELSRPMHLAVRDERVYVPDYLSDRIRVFDREGRPLESIGGSGSGPGQFDAPGGVAVDAQGRLYVADFYNQRVQVLDARGNFLLQVGTTGRKGIRAGRFNYPTDVDLLPGGELVVADAYNDRVQVFRPDGRFLRKWGGLLAMNLSGSRPGWFRTATAVAVAPDGSIWVADFENHRVQRFDFEGRWLEVLGGPGSGEGEFEHPTDVAVDDEGDLYVADFGNDRVQVLRPDPGRGAGEDGR